MVTKSQKYIKCLIACLFSLGGGTIRGAQGQPAVVADCSSQQNGRGIKLKQELSDPHIPIITQATGIPAPVAALILKYVGKKSFRWIAYTPRGTHAWVAGLNSYSCWQTISQTVDGALRVDNWRSIYPLSRALTADENNIHNALVLAFQDAASIKQGVSAAQYLKTYPEELANRSLEERYGISYAVFNTFQRLLECSGVVSLPAGSKAHDTGVRRSTFLLDSAISFVDLANVMRAFAEDLQQKRSAPLLLADSSEQCLDEISDQNVDHFLQIYYKSPVVWRLLGWDKEGANEPVFI